MSEMGIKKVIDRRGFLGGVAGLGAAAAVGVWGAPARAIEPVKRAFGPHFKFSLAGYSYRDLFTGKKYVEKPITIEDFINDCASMQLDGTELTSYYFPKDITADGLREIKRKAFLLGLDVSGTAVGNDFTHPPGPVRDEQIALVKKWVDNAETLSAPVIRIFAGKVKQGQTEAEARRLVVEAIEECCDYAGKHGVILALENHGGITTEPAGLLSIVREVQSPWLGVNFDSGNFRGEDVYAELAEIAPYAVNVQIKAMVKPKGKGKVPSDYKRVAKIVRDAGYRGYVVLEFEEPEDPRVACPRELEKLREAFA